MTRKFLFAVPASLLLLCLAVAGCELMSVAELTRPGRVQVFVQYDMPDDYPVVPGDSLDVLTREFRLYKDTLYAEVYQHPDQYMFREDSLVSFNMLDLAREGQPIQIAHSSVAPLEYDRLVFELSPTDWVKITGTRYPLRRAGENAGTVLEIQERIPIEEDRTTKIYLTISVPSVLRRIGDEFVFTARADSFVVEDAE